METTYNYCVLPIGGMANAPDPGGGAYPAADCWDGITEHVFTDQLGASRGTKIVMVWAHDNRIVIRFSYDGVTYGDDTVLYDAAQAEPFYLSAQRFQVINFVPGSTAVYQVMGQW